MAKRKPLGPVGHLRWKAAKIAEQSLGIVEKGGNNRGPEVEKIIRKNGGVPGEPWCGDFQAYCYLLAGAKSVVRGWASVVWIEQHLMKVRRLGAVRRGHIVTFDFTGDHSGDHVEMFWRWINKSRGVFETIGGNTGTEGRRSDGQGDGVHKRTRYLRDVDGFFRVLR